MSLSPFLPQFLYPPGKINQNKQLARTVDPRTISWGPDFTPAFADFGRPASGGRGSPVSLHTCWRYGEQSWATELYDCFLAPCPPPTHQLLNVGTRRPQPRKIIMNVSVNDDVQLRKAEKAWKPGIKQEALADDPDTQRTQVTFDPFGFALMPIYACYKCRHSPGYNGPFYDFSTVLRVNLFHF